VVFVDGGVSAAGGCGKRAAFRSWCWRTLAGVRLCSANPRRCLTSVMGVVFYFVPPSAVAVASGRPYAALAIARFSWCRCWCGSQHYHWIHPHAFWPPGGLDTKWKPTWGGFHAGQPLLCSDLHLATAGLRSCLAREKRINFALFFSRWARRCLFFYLLYTFARGGATNWIAPVVVPLFAVMALYFERRWEKSGPASGVCWRGLGLVAFRLSW